MGSFLSTLAYKLLIHILLYSVDPGIHYMRKQDRKTVWSLKVHPLLKEWYQDYASTRGTDPQEEARRALADFRDNHISNIPAQGATGWQL